MDVLTSILSSLRLTGGIVFDAVMHGDWCTVSQFSPDHCASYFPVSQQIISYHYVRRGVIHVELADAGEHAVVREGAIVLFPRNDVHTMASRPGLPPTDLADITRPTDGAAFNAIFLDGDGEETSIFCGWLGGSSGNHPLLDALPAMMVVDAPDGGAAEWMRSSLRYASAELHDSPEMVAKLSEVLFAQAVRRYVDGLRAGEGGWLAGLRDPAVARALAIIHARFAEDLDTESLAREVGVSRSVLGERFAALLGEPPMRYCARWRMRMAANMLREGKHNSANIAYAVGFNSEAAFNRAFKREYHEPPATWRRRVEAEERTRRTRSTALPPQVVRYCDAHDGTRLAYSVIGEGPPLVKTANWLNHLDYDFESPLWQPWLRELTRDFSLIRYDERGNGLSDWDTPELSLDAFVDDLACVVDAAGVDRFDLLAISQGAAVAVAFAVRHPERVRRLVICGGYARGWANRDNSDELARREAMLTLTRLGWGDANGAYRKLFTDLYIPGATPAQAEWWTEMQKRSASPENAVRIMRALSLLDVRPLLPQLTIPTLLFHSEGDLVVPIAEGRLLADGLANSRFIPLASANHVPLSSEPAFRTFMDETHRFLSAP